MLKKLKDAIEDEDTLITKEYVKGRENLCVNPAIPEYNKTANAANQTVTTLIKIIEQLSDSTHKTESLGDTMKKLKQQAKQPRQNE